MARRATVIAQMRAEAQGPVLLLDSGGSLIGQHLSNQSDGKIIIEAMNAMAYDAMTVGYRDMQKGLDVLLARAEEARFPLLSCNVVERATGKSLFEPYTVIERGGLRIGILGVSEVDTVELADVRERLEALDPVETVKRYLPELREQADVVILLSHVGLVNERRIAGEAPGMIDLIVGGQSREVFETLEREGSTMVVHAGFNGEWLGIFQGTRDGQGQWIAAEATARELGPDVADDPTLAALVQSYGQVYPTPTSSLDPRYLTPSPEASDAAPLPIETPGAATGAPHPVPSAPTIVLVPTP